MMASYFWLVDGRDAAGKPCITKYGFEDLGDDPAAHRWRAWWTGDGIDPMGISLQPYPVIKLTPCGAWISRGSWRSSDGQWQNIDNLPRIVMNRSHQAWAKPTQEAALHSLAVRLCRWSSGVARDFSRAHDAAKALAILKPDLADFADVAMENLKQSLQGRA